MASRANGEQAARLALLAPSPLTMLRLEAECGLLFKLDSIDPGRHEIQQSGPVPLAIVTQCRCQLTFQILSVHPFQLGGDDRMMMAFLVVNTAAVMMFMLRWRRLGVHWW